ncbi:TPA: hypothetical protein TVQ98_001895 [Streptococcus equi subsp. zooepidemicus]|nr:hypothetical protein [Streptococcus equi subsp. zooepidemicus]HEL0713228.1 hypothetical protein [Streptococcus equi subsp. zooepidemicus]HEL0738276.1 hypothetical protein [Streptococcus equi subsp. zooepidemicus]HEL0769150.1 hypothetical protein [Streptococcus equi subsp. zooepidemicus]HEL1303055.1 hypothetical protein [Streptococcus equi subsp. zooepidemicus]
MNEPIAAKVTKPTYNRQQLLKNLENNRLARESSRFKNYVAREKFTTTLAGMSLEDSQRYIQWNKYAKAGLSPSDRIRVLEISKKAPKVEYILDTYTKQDILDIKPNPDKGIFRPDIGDYLTSDYIKAHRRQFDNGAIKIQKFTPQEGGFNNGAIGNPKDHVVFVMPKDVGETLIDVSKGEPRILEDLLGLHLGDLGDSPVAIDIPKESIRNLRIPSGNEGSAFEGYWKPGGRTYPGNMPEAVIDEVPWGDYTIRPLGGN